MPTEYTKRPTKTVAINGAPMMASFTSTTSYWPARYARPMAGVAKVDMPKIVRIRACPAMLKPRSIARRAVGPVAPGVPKWRCSAQTSQQLLAFGSGLPADTLCASHDTGVAIMLVVLYRLISDLDKTSAGAGSSPRPGSGRSSRTRARSRSSSWQGCRSRSARYGPAQVGVRTGCSSASTRAGARGASPTGC